MKRAFFCIILAVTAISSTAAPPIRVACVGDSSTFGVRITDRVKNCYPTVLGQLPGKIHEVKNFGVNGAPLLKKGDRPYWNLKAFMDAMVFAPQIVIIKLGTNDTKPQSWGKVSDEFEAVLRAIMISHFRRLPGQPQVYLCLTEPVYQTRWGINDKLVKAGVIPIVEKVAKDEKLPVIDLYKALSGKPEIFPDNIHPNVAGARVMAQAIRAALTK